MKKVFTEIEANLAFKHGHASVLCCAGDGIEEGYAVAENMEEVRRIYTNEG